MERTDSSPSALLHWKEHLLSFVHYHCTFDQRHEIDDQLFYVLFAYWWNVTQIASLRREGSFPYDLLSKKEVRGELLKSFPDKLACRVRGRFNTFTKRGEPMTVTTIVGLYALPIQQDDYPYANDVAPIEIRNFFYEVVETEDEEARPSTEKEENYKRLMLSKPPLNLIRWNDARTFTSVPRVTFDPAAGNASRIQPKVSTADGREELLSEKKARKKQKKELPDPGTL